MGRKKPVTEGRCLYKNGRRTSPPLDDQKVLETIDTVPPCGLSLPVIFNDLCIRLLVEDEDNFYPNLFIGWFCRRRQVAGFQGQEGTVAGVA
jgi:hypothetical protein